MNNKEQEVKYLRRMLELTTCVCERAKLIRGWIDDFYNDEGQVKENELIMTCKTDVETDYEQTHSCDKFFYRLIGLEDELEDYVEEAKRPAYTHIAVCRESWKSEQRSGEQPFKNTDSEVYYDVKTYTIL